MRFSAPIGFLVLVALTLLGAAVVRAQPNSMSPQQVQRRLEADTTQLLDSLRSQRNTPSQRPFEAGKSPLELHYEARKLQREQDRQAAAESARLDAEWRRDHPNETRAQYFARLEREGAEQARERVRQQSAEAAAERARAIAEEAQRIRAVWDDYRAGRFGYAAHTRPPAFTTTPEALAWYLAHARAHANEWAANQAAMLLLEGVHVPQDIAQVVALLDPRIPRVLKDGQPHSETRTLRAYLQLANPAAWKAGDLTPDPAAARAELDELARYSYSPGHACFYLARFLADSSAPADRSRAFGLLVTSHRWMRADYAVGIAETPQGRTALLEQLAAVLEVVLQKTSDQLPAAFTPLSLYEFQYLAGLLPAKTKKLHDRVVPLYAEAIATRAVPATPAENFDYDSFERVLVEALELGSDVPHGLSFLRRCHLLDGDDTSFSSRGWDRGQTDAKTIAALARWGSRDDVLGARSRIALREFAAYIADPQTWSLPFLPEMLAWWRRSDGKTPATRAAALAAVARRDASAPPVDALPRLVAACEAARQWEQGMRQIEAYARSTQPDASPAFAVEHASFDLTRAAAEFDAAYAPGVSAVAQQYHLLNATSLGDAFAPLALAQILGRRTIEIGAYAKLEKLAAARRARDEAARRPRAFLARVLEARLTQQELEPALSRAVSAGSALATRLQLSKRIDESMAREIDRPMSWNLPPALVAELDAAVIALEARPDSLAELSLLNVVMSSSEAANTDHWFFSVAQWDADRRVRGGDDSFFRAHRPQIDALVATLAQWPGLNHNDPRHEGWVTAAEGFRDQAERLVKSDGPGAFALFMQAAGRGDRGAVEMFSNHIRNGTGGLPRSAAFADLLQTAVFKMAQADAEVGDAFAADFVGDSLLTGRAVAKDPAAGVAWLRYAAELGQNSAAVALADQHGGDDPKDRAARRRWNAVAESILHQQFLPSPPRRLASDAIALTPILPKLEAALAAATRRLAGPQAQPLTEAEEEAQHARYVAAEEQLKKDPAAGLVALAQCAAAGHQKASFALAQILASGGYGLRPDLPLARRFHALGFALLQRTAEEGDMFAAHHLGAHHLDLAEKPDLAAAIRWLTYAAELGDSSSAQALAELYTTGAPGLPADSKAAARWTAFDETIGSDNFKPRAPLR